MTLNELFEITTDRQKLCITADDRRYSGHWYEDHMLDLLSRYKYHKVDITVETPDITAATVRRY